MTSLDASPEEVASRDEVLGRVLDAIRSNRTIRLPAFDSAHDKPGLVALQSVGIEPNPFGGKVGPFRYQFEGEEDLLHLIVSRTHAQDLSVEEAQGVVRFLLPNISPGLIWCKPGKLTQHFYLGHDELLR